MNLNSLLEKGWLEGVATAISATSATDGQELGATVAKIATVAVANPKFGSSGRQTPALSEGEEAAILAWLAHIAETDPAVIDDVLNQCRIDPDTRGFFLGQANEF